MNDQLYIEILETMIQDFLKKKIGFSTLKRLFQTAKKERTKAAK